MSSQNENIGNETGPEGHDWYDKYIRTLDTYTYMYPIPTLRKLLEYVYIYSKSQCDTYICRVQCVVNVVHESDQGMRTNEVRHETSMSVYISILLPSMLVSFGKETLHGVLRRCCTIIASGAHQHFAVGGSAGSGSVAAGHTLRRALV